MKIENQGLYIKDITMWFMLQKSKQVEIVLWSQVTQKIRHLRIETGILYQQVNYITKV